MTSAHLLALDVGAARIGVALASTEARLANPAGAVQQGPDALSAIRKLCSEHNVIQLVVGLPRGLDGQETAQTGYVREFVRKLAEAVEQPISLIDEAVTSKQAEEELRTRGKPYSKADIDALAATYILEDYLRQEGQNV